MNKTNEAAEPREAKPFYAAVTGEGNHVKASEANVPSAPRDKRGLYKTAKAMIGCAYFKAGDIVGLKYYGIGYSEGKPGHYFLCCTPNQDQWACYPEHHLCNFVL